MANHCTLDDCDGAASGRGLCKYHYQVAYRAGTLPPDLKARTLDEALAMRTERVGTCLIWTGSKLRGGYGNLKIKSVDEVQVHRAVWAQANGPIPKGMLVDHRCFNHACAELEHLRLATKKQNNENLSGAHTNSKTGVRGVHKHKNRYIVQVGKRGGDSYRGSFKTLEEATEASKRVRLELFTFNAVDRGEHIESFAA